MSLSSEVVQALRSIVGNNNVLVEDLAGFGTDWTGRFVGNPSLVVRPGSTNEVSQVMELCSRHKVEVVPQGGNTGLVGGSLATTGQIIISMRRLNWLGEVDLASQQVSVGAGATLEQIQVVAQNVGLRYAVDFGARGTATIGGSIATNAGGINVLRYGSTRNQLVGIEVVLSHGEVIEHMKGLIKDNTGYDIGSLFCGSEGTLGIVTAARLRLVPKHPYRSAVLLGCDSVEAVLNIVQEVRRRFDFLDAAEMFFADGAKLVHDAFGYSVPFDAQTYLLLDFSSDADQMSELGTWLSGLNFAGPSAISNDDLSRAKLWRLREEHTAAIATLGVPHKFDVTVAVADLPEFIEKIRQQVHQTNSGWSVYIFGHAADGNMHVNVLGPEPNDESVDEIVLRTVADFKGSISAEHGVGSAKKKWLSLSRSPLEIETMRSIKRALDPQGLMNPHTLFV